MVVFGSRLAMLFAIGTATAFALGAAPGLANRLPEVDLLTGGEIGPPQDQPIAAAAARSGRVLVARSEQEGQRLALYVLVPASPPAPAPTALPAQSPSAPPPSPSPQAASAPAFHWPWQSAATTPPTPAPTPALPAFDVHLLASQRQAVAALAMAGNGHKTVLGVLGRDPGGFFVAAHLWLGSAPGMRKGLSGTLAPSLILSRGPAAPSHLAVAVADDGDALLAWTAALPGRPFGLRLRAIEPDRSLGPLQILAQPGFEQRQPALAAAPWGFLLAYVDAAARSASGGNDSPPPTGIVPALALIAPATPSAPAEAERSAYDRAADAPGAWPRTQIVSRPLDGKGAASGTPFSESSWGLEHPGIIGRKDGFHVFWTDPQGGGRELRFRAATKAGWQGPERELRTDLRPQLASPYAIVPVGDALWLAIYPQYQEDGGQAMVLEGRLYYPQDLAISPPLLLARSDGAMTLDGLVPAGSDTWIALWDEIDGGQHHLAFRPLHVTL